jgi:hypothetical protein
MYGPFLYLHTLIYILLNSLCYLSDDVSFRVVLSADKPSLKALDSAVMIFATLHAVLLIERGLGIHCPLLFLVMPRFGSEPNSNLNF